jgi:hypothetical protein
VFRLRPRPRFVGAASVKPPRPTSGLTDEETVDAGDDDLALACHRIGCFESG